MMYTLEATTNWGPKVPLVVSVTVDSDSIAVTAVVFEGMEIASVGVGFAVTVSVTTAVPGVPSVNVMVLGGRVPSTGPVGVDPLTQSISMFGATAAVDGALEFVPSAIG